MRKLTSEENEKFILDCLYETDQEVETSLEELVKKEISFINNVDVVELIEKFGNRRVVGIFSPKTEDRNYGDCMEGYVYLECTEEDAKQIHKITSGKLRFESFEDQVRMCSFEIE